MDNHDETPSLRKHLHDATGQVSLALLQVSLLLEAPDLDPAVRAALLEVQHACRIAGEALRAAWRATDRP